MDTKRILHTVAVACVVGSLLSCGGSHEVAANEEWIALFNGKDLTGWDIKIAGYDLNDNVHNTFVVKDSIMQVDYSGYKTFDGAFGHIYYQTPYSYYRVRLQYRFGKPQLQGGPDYAYLNSGIMVHSQSAASLTKDQTFPVSLEMQFLAADSVEPHRHTGNLCTPGTEVEIDGQYSTQHCVDSSSPNYGPDGWISVEAVVLGDSIVHHIVEGDTVLTYTRPRIGGNFVNADMNWTRGGFADSVKWMGLEGTLLKEGYIALQAESHPLEFRRVELLNLKGCTDPKATNYKPYYIKSDNASCIYK